MENRVRSPGVSFVTIERELIVGNTQIHHTIAETLEGSLQRGTIGVPYSAPRFT